MVDFYSNFTEKAHKMCLFRRFIGHHCLEDVFNVSRAETRAIFESDGLRL